MELLERLEISEIELSKLERTNRLDTEFYTKENLKVLNILKKHTLTSIFDLTKVSDGNHMAISDNFTEIGIPYYRGQDIHNYFIEQGTPICIDENSYNIPNMKRSHLQKGDVLLSIVGTIGGVSLVTTEDKATCNCKLAILRPKKVNGYYLSAFLKSKFGQNQIHKFTRGAVQKGLILEDMNQIFVPDFSIEFQSKISDLIEKARITISQSIITYSQAESILLKEIGLEKEVTGLNPVEVTNKAVEGSNPSIFTNNGANKNVNVKSFKDSFGVTGRLDAEYYQKKYEVVIEKIKSQKYDTLRNIVTITKSLEPGSNYYSDDETGLPFMRVADYNKFGLSEPNKKLTFDYIKDNQDKIDNLKPKKGSILFSKDGSVGTAYHLRHDFEGITSSAILNLKVINEKEVIPEYLTLALNSKLVQMQAERDAGGSIILHWRIGEIQNVVVPIIDYSKQQQIAKLIEESFAIKKESEHLLEVAKRAVEIAIEENEEVAMAYINKNVK